MADSNAHRFFSRFKASADKVAFLHSLIDLTNPTFEEEWLDFKAGDRIDDPQVKKTWSEGLAAFGNTAGGVIVFGIDCRKTPSLLDPSKTIDAASKVALVPHPAVLRSRLMELHHVATDPPLGGVEVEHVDEPSLNGGFVVCYIPEGESKPYRAELTKNHPYLIRVGDDIVVPNRSLLRNLFFPQTRMSVQLSINANINDEASAIKCNLRPGPNLYVFLTNTGASSIDDIVLNMGALRSDHQGSGTYYQTDFLAASIYDGVAARLTYPIHPGQTINVGNMHSTSPVGQSVWHLKFNIYARNAGLQTATVSFTARDFQDCVTKYVSTTIPLTSQERSEPEVRA